MRKIRILSMLLAALIALCLFAGFPAAANAADDNGDGYHDGDVEIINAIISVNGLIWTKDDPAYWPSSGVSGGLE